MTRPLVNLALLLLLTPPLVAAPTARYVVALEHGAHPIDVALKNRGVATFAALDAFAADLTDAEAKELRRSKSVRYVERVATRYILGFAGRGATDVDRNLEGQTVPPGVDLIHARDVWRVTRGSLVNVAVIDTGVDYSHP